MPALTIKTRKTPGTISEAVDLLICSLPLKDRAEIARMEEKEFVELQVSLLGLYIRSEFVIWSENKELMDDCCSFAENDDLSGNSASAIIIKELWKKLQKTHLLRVVK